MFNKKIYKDQNEMFNSLMPPFGRGEEFRSCSSCVKIFQLFDKWRFGASLLQDVRR